MNIFNLKKWNEKLYSIETNHIFHPGLELVASNEKEIRLINNKILIL